MDVSYLTDEELISLIATEGGTKREVELAERLTRALDLLEEDNADDDKIAFTVRGEPLL